MTKNAFAVFAGSACVLLLCSAGAFGQLSGTSLLVTGTGTINTLVSGNATIGLLEVTGTADFQDNTWLFGSSGTNPGISFGYSDGTSGTNSNLSQTATRPLMSWTWQRLTASGTSTVTAMKLDASNRLILTGTAASNPPQIVMDPNGSISLNGSNLITQSTADTRYLSSNAISTYDGNIGIATDFPSHDFQIGDVDTLGSMVFDRNYLDTGKGFFGIYANDNNLYYGILTSLPTVPGAASIGGYFQGLGIGGASADVGLPIFGILNSQQCGCGLGSVAFTVYDNNLIQTYNNILDDGTGGANFYYVGIGTNSPQATLDVQGNARFSGAIRVEPQGDLSMGEFTTEKASQTPQRSLPEQQNSAGKNLYSPMSGLTFSTSGSSSSRMSGTATNH